MVTKVFSIEIWARKGNAISRKELIWDNEAFLAANGVSVEHIISRKVLIWGNKAFLIENGAIKRHVISRKEPKFV